MYVVVDIPSYTGPPWDQENPTFVPVPKLTTVCDRGCCSRESCPLILAWAITTHRFQGQSAGPVDEGKIPNAYECVVFDPDTKKMENTWPGLFYTGTSRGTTLGDREGLNSAVYFDGPDATISRMQFLGLKPDSNDFCDNYRARKKWMDYLDGNTYTYDMDQQHVSDLLLWLQSSQYEYGWVEGKVLSYV